MATLLHPDGKTEDLGVLDPNDPTVVERLQRWVGGAFEFINLADGDLLAVNEAGIHLALPRNLPATTLAAGRVLMLGGIIRGPAVRLAFTEAYGHEPGSSYDEAW